MTDFKFFSEEWCQAAHQAVKNAADQIRPGYHDAATFTHVLAFDCTDRPGAAVHVDFEKGEVMSFTTKLFPEDDVWSRFAADLETWRSVAEGDVLGSELIMANKIKIAKGLMKPLVENADAFNNFVMSWGDVPTDWDI